MKTSTIFYLTVFLSYIINLNVYPAAEVLYPQEEELAIVVDEATPEQKLLWAAALGRTDEVRQLIESGANVNAVNDNGETPLIKASASGHKEVVELLLASKANVNAISNEVSRNTALISAAANGHKDIVQLLLSAEADIDPVDYAGMSALDYAKLQYPYTYVAYEIRMDMVKLLEDAKKKKEDKAVIEKRSESIIKITSEHIPSVLSNIVTGYAVGDIEDVPEGERKSDYL